MKKLLFISMTLLVLVVKAQQEPIFSQFWNAKTYYNPSMTGVGFKHLSTTIGRWQNVGVNGQPVTQLLGYALRSKKLHGGIGFTYMREEIGANLFNKTKFNYSYHIATKNGGTFSIGAGAGFNALKVDLVMPEISDTKGVGFTADFGITYAIEKSTISLSCTQLNSGRITDQYSESPHVVFMTDYIFGKDEGFQFKPQAFVMTDLNKLTYDINATLLWKGKVGAGVTFRSNEDLAFSVNWDILKKFRIGYAYDLALGALAGESKGSHTGFFGLVFR
jgi:type IX secretion system PorP/SprF family membrane protein